MVMSEKALKYCVQKRIDRLTQYQYCTPIFGRSMLTWALCIHSWAFPTPILIFLSVKNNRADLDNSARFCFLYCSVIQQKVCQPDIQDTAVVVPALADIFANDDFRERIICQSERF